MSRAERGSGSAPRIGVYASAWSVVSFINPQPYTTPVSPNRSIVLGFGEWWSVFFPKLALKI